MRYLEYQDAKEFLNATQSVLERNEALYGLMLGITMRIVNNPQKDNTLPLMATVFENDKILLAVLMTPPYKLQIASLTDEREEAVKFFASQLHKEDWKVPGVISDEITAKCFESEWTKLTGQQSKHGMRQRIYQLHEVIPPRYPGGNYRKLTKDDITMATKWCNSFHNDCFGKTDPDKCRELVNNLIGRGDLYIWQDPLPVSMTGYARPTRNGVSINFVYTPPEFRKRGYASALVATLSELALKGGKQFCMLYTDLSNPVSNSIYKKIGFKEVADVMDIIFI